MDSATKAVNQAPARDISLHRSPPLLQLQICSYIISKIAIFFFGGGGTSVCIEVQIVPYSQIKHNNFST